MYIYVREYMLPICTLNISSSRLSFRVFITDNKDIKICPINNNNNRKKENNVNIDRHLMYSSNRLRSHAIGASLVKVEER